MARPRSTFGKLQRDHVKRERAKAKQEDRAARRADRSLPGDEKPQQDEDQQALLEQFAQLHDDLADGRISLDEFESLQEQLRSRLRVD